MAKFNLADSGEDFIITKKREEKVTPVKDEKISPSARKETVVENIPDEQNSEKEEKKETVRKTREQKQKQKQGRPPLKEKGLKARKQYTLTLLEDTYNQIIESAMMEGVSFAKYMEKAVLEYMENHKHN